MAFKSKKILTVGLAIVFGLVIFGGLAKGVGASKSSDARTLNQQIAELRRQQLNSEGRWAWAGIGANIVAIPFSAVFDAVDYLQGNYQGIAAQNIQNIREDIGITSAASQSDQSYSRDVNALNATQRLRTRLRELEDQLAAATTPEARAAIQAQIDNTQRLLEQNAANMANDKSSMKDAATAAVSSSSGNSLADILGLAVSYFLYFIAYGLGVIMMIAIKVMLTIATYNGFLTQPAVKVGWTIVRDVCNNFFIVLMLMMAVGTALNQQAFQWRNMLPKILLMAVLINFSKMFTGILIDASQVLMLTFAAPLATSTAYNIILASFGLPSFMQLSNLTTQMGTDTSGNATKTGSLGDLSWWDIIAALLFAIIVTIAALVVIIVIAITLAYRIVMLWFLVILSPAWIFSKSFNKLGEISSIWEGDMKKYLVVGPAMMFFLYLSFMTLSTVSMTGAGSPANSNVLGGNSKLSAAEGGGKFEGGEVTLSGGGDQNIALSNMASPNGLINVLIVVGLLWASLMMGQRFGGAAAKWSGTGMNWMKKYTGANLAQNLAKKVGGYAGKVPGYLGTKVGQKVGTGALGVATGVTRLAGAVTGSEGLTKLADVGTQWRKDVLKGRRDARSEKMAKFMGKVGLGSDEAKAAWGEFTKTELAKRAKTIATGVGTVAAGTGAVLATGGLGLVPAALAGAAGIYLGGGGRLLEMALGKGFKAKVEARKAEKEKIKAERGVTEQTVADAMKNKNQEIKDQTEAREKTRDNEIKVEDDKLKAFENKSSAAKKAKTAQEKIDRIENQRLDNMPLGAASLDQELVDELKKAGWDEIKQLTQDELDAAKEAVLNGPTGKGKDWKKDIADFDTALEAEKNKRNTAVEIINNAHNTDVEAIRTTEEAKFKTAVSDQLNTKVAGQEISEAEKDRWQGEYTAKVKLELDTKKLEDDLKLEIARIDGGAGTDLQKADERRKAEKRRDVKMEEVNSNYNQAVEKVQVKTSQPGLDDKFMESYEPYAHENWVSQAVAKKARQESERIKDIIDSAELGGDMFDGFSTFSQGKFYSGSGQTSEQYKTFEALTKTSKGIEKMIAALNDIKDKEGNLVDGLKGNTAKMVEELKKGLAAFSKGGGDTTKLSGLIAALNQKYTITKDDNEERNTVKDYEDKVKAKK
jgi:hypothetical protein